MKNSITPYLIAINPHYGVTHQFY